MDFRYAQAFERQPAEAYERLLLDCMRGDPTLFARRDEVELSWEFVDPLLEPRGDPQSYARGGQGPESAAAIPGRLGHAWEAIR
jgi:glucose-6-phosphate 1-dehydrogenase